MSILSGLMAGANFGTGYNVGQQQSTQEDNVNAMNALALQDRQMQTNQMQTQQKNTADTTAAMAALQANYSSPPPITTATGQVVPGTGPTAQGTTPSVPMPEQAKMPPPFDSSLTGGPPAPAPTMPPPTQAPNTTSQAPSDNTPPTVTTEGLLSTNDAIQQHMNLLANTALQRDRAGDIVNSTALMDQVSKGMNNLATQAARNTTSQVAMMKARASAIGQTSAILGAAANQGEGAYNQALMGILNDPGRYMLTPQDSQTLAQKQWTPELGNQFLTTGMNAAQQMASQAKELEIKEHAREDSMQDQYRQVIETNSTARVAIQQQRVATQGKVGATATAPTTAQLSMASSMVKDAMSADGSTPSPKDVLEASQGVASRATQISGANRNSTYQQAIAQAIDESKQNGDFVSNTAPSSNILGMPVPFTGGNKTTSYTPHGLTAAQPIILNAKPNAASLIQGHYYQNSSGKVGMWTGKGFTPVQ